MTRNQATEREVTPAERRQREQAPLKLGLYVKSANGLRLRYRKVRRLVLRMHSAMPWLAEVDLPAARAWAELEILSATAFAWLYTNGLTNEAGEPRRLLADYRQLRTAQLAFERELGMTPLARMALRVGDARARSLGTPEDSANDREAVENLEARLLDRLGVGATARETTLGAPEGEQEAEGEVRDGQEGDDGSDGG